MNKPACLKLVKIPGRYQVTIMLCMSTTMHGVETVTLFFSGGYRHCQWASFIFDVPLSGFRYLFGSLSA